GYPVVQQRKSETRRRDWFDSYITTILQRDIREISEIEDLTLLPRLLALLASRSCTLLETTFLVRLLNPWSVNIGKRIVKAPNVYLNDTGLLAHLVGLDHSISAPIRVKRST
ncbi:MAG: DUF4143 domain-containing protein, partial [Acidobacteriota bacterium]|nr:DUF4143 domain-containing protein [Acidobacteriota bacterium]